MQLLSIWMEKKSSTRKKRVFAPGEMEEILLKKQDVFDKKNAQKEHTLVIKMEEEDNERSKLTCIGCPLGCSISVSLSDNGEVSEITGNTCKKGEEYARKEVTNPSRVVTSIVKINNGDVNMVSVKTAEDNSKRKNL